MAVDSPDTSGEDGGLSGLAYDGTVLGGIFGGMLILIGAVFIYACCVRCQKKRKARITNPEEELGLGSGLTRDTGHQTTGHRQTEMANGDMDEGVPESLNVSVPRPIHRRQSGYSRHTKEDLQPLRQKLPTDTLTFAMLEADIDERRLKLEDVIAMGTYSLVYNGTLTSDKSQTEGKNQLINVKTIQGAGCTPIMMKKFLEDGLQLRSYSHQNVLSLVGLVNRDDQPYLLYPRTNKGVLHTYLTELNQHFTVRALIQMGLDVAQGLKYLSAQGFVHKDLASRNCLIADDGHVMIGDCALSQDLFDEDYFNVEQLSHSPLPIGWMAVETLTQLSYSLQSDVWAMGVVLWELLTRGQAPYADKDPETIIAYVRAGQRLEKPTAAPDILYKLMLSCWMEDLYIRPSIRLVCESLTTLLSKPA